MRIRVVNAVFEKLGLLSQSDKEEKKIQDHDLATNLMNLSVADSSFLKDELYCVISLSTIENPAFLSNCGHGFELESIQQYMQKKMGRPAPFAVNHLNRVM